MVTRARKRAQSMCAPPAKRAKHEDEAVDAHCGCAAFVNGVCVAITNGECCAEFALRKCAAVKAESADNKSTLSKMDHGGQLFIKSLTGKTVVVRVLSFATDRVADIMARIYDQENIHPDQQRLIFNGSQLDRGMLLSDCKIEKACSLHLVLRLRGGMLHETSGRENFQHLVSTPGQYKIFVTLYSTLQEHGRSSVPLDSPKMLMLSMSGDHVYISSMLSPVSAKLGIPADQLEFMYDGRILSRTKTFHSYNIPSSSLLFAVARTHVGSNGQLDLAAWLK
jgi:hypothetical protein